MTTTDFSNKKCAPCEGIGHAMSKEEAAGYVQSFPGWMLSQDGKSIERSYVLKNFVQAVELINRIKDVAEAENHHPDLHLQNYRNLRIDLSTHAINGLSENAFI